MLADLNDKDEIAAFLRQSPGLHVYALGDLDPFFWPYTRWFGWRDRGLQAVCLLYSGAGAPTLLALSDAARSPAMKRLLGALEPRLPHSVYAHLSPELLDVFPRAAWRRRLHGGHVKMLLSSPDAVERTDVSRVASVDVADLAGIRALYDLAYPGNWFVPRMLETGLFRGIRDRGEWLAAGGVHVFSGERRVAAIGNVATHPEHRRRGYARAVTAAICAELLQRTDVIGLNVHIENLAAHACYESLGFSAVAEYEEVLLERT